LTEFVAAPAARLTDVPPSGIRAIFDRARELEDQGVHIYHLEIGRPDFDTPALIKRATVEALDAGAVHYASNWGISELRRAIAAKLSRDSGLTYSPADEIVVTIGANEAVWIAMMAYVDPGDEVIIPTPAWPHYAQCVRLAGGIPIVLQLEESDDWRIDPEALARLITPRTRMVVLCTPQNPTGAVLDRPRLEAIAAVLQGTNVIALSDEIYEHLIYDEASHVSPASIAGMWDRTLLVSGFAKAYAMDGWRLGYLAGPRDLVKWALRVHQYTTVCAPTFEQYGAAAALDGPQDDRERMVAEFARRRRAILDLLSDQDIVTYSKAEGAFYIWLTYPENAPTASELAIGLLEEQHVAVVPGTAFDETQEHGLRIAYAAPLEDVTEGIRRLIEYVRLHTTGITTPETRGSLVDSSAG
jgi:aspartate/methionine/tyrosine aminotransferase